MGAEHFLLTWNNHRSNLAEVFCQLRVQEQLVDVTLLCDGGSYPAHRLVLAAVSPYFHQLFSRLPTQHPIVYLRDVKQAELEALLEFIYCGQVSVANDELEGLMRIAESLHIKGLTSGNTQSNPQPASSSSPPPCKIPRLQPLQRDSSVGLSLASLLSSANSYGHLVAQESDQDIKHEDGICRLRSHLEGIKDPSTGGLQDISVEEHVQKRNLEEEQKNDYATKQTVKTEVEIESYDEDDNSSETETTNETEANPGISTWAGYVLSLQNYDDHLQLSQTNLESKLGGGVATDTMLLSPIKSMTCQLCGATIKHVANFRRHMKQHLNPRRFPCPFCSAAFGRKDNLKTHTRKHHSTTDEEMMTDGGGDREEGGEREEAERAEGAQDEEI